MPSGFLDNTTRQQLLRRLTRLTAATPNASAPALPASCPTSAHPDAMLLGACAAFSVVESEKLALFEGPNRIQDDEARDAAIEPLWARQVPLLEQVCTCHATTLVGHRARAAVYWLWDAGELTWHARTTGMLEDRLLAALIADLVGAL